LNSIKTETAKRREEASFESVHQKESRVTLPPSVYVEASNIQVLNDIAGNSGIKPVLDNPASWLLANFSASIDEVSESLSFERRADPGWKTRVFDRSKLYFSYGTDGNSASFSLKEYTHPVTKQFKHWLWDGEKSAEVERDWGRYLSLSSTGLNIMLYDQKLRLMAVPATVPPPCILSRSLVMCSGAAPVIVKTPLKKIGDIPRGSLLQVYRLVPTSVAGMVSGKLGQKLISVSFQKNNMAV
jgi:hypothetical protein